MDEKVFSLLTDKPIVTPRILFNNYKRLGITEEELVILILIISLGDKIVYDPSIFVRELNMEKHLVMKIISSLIEKNILSLLVEKNNKKAEEYISTDVLYKKLLNIVIDRPTQDEEKEVDGSIFSTFESELGRTLSPMEYEQIKEWITSGNKNELITEALKEAVLNGVSNFRYIDSILNGWKKKGYKTKNDIIKDREVYRNKSKDKAKVFDTDWLND